MKHISWLFLVILLLQVFTDTLIAFDESANSLEQMERGVKRKAIITRRISPAKINCGYECSRRCSKASRKKVCSRACIACCRRCDCVPPGTYGNKEACPCYATLKTKGNRPKCP